MPREIEERTKRTWGDLPRVAYKRQQRARSALDRGDCEVRRECQYAKRVSHSWGIVVFYRYKPTSRIFRKQFAGMTEFKLWWTAFHEDVTIVKEFWPRTHVSRSVKRRPQLYGVPTYDFSPGGD